MSGSATTRAATEAELPAVAALIAAAPQAGRMELAQDRRIDPGARARPFDEACTFVVDGDDGPDAAVTVGRKEAAVTGSWGPVAYVFDLAVAPAARGRGLAGDLLAEVDRWAGARDALAAYGNVMTGNDRAAVTFARAGYTHAADLRGEVLPVRRGPQLPGRARPASSWAADDWDRAASLLRAGSTGRDLARRWDGPRLRAAWEALPGWRAEDVWTTDRALLGLWDHRTVAQQVPQRLPTEVRAVQLGLTVAERLGMSGPRVPRLGVPLHHGVVLGGVGHVADLRALTAGAVGRAHARGLDLLIGFTDARERAVWARGQLRVPARYQVLARRLGAGSRLGERPLWVDPIDL